MVAPVLAATKPGPSYTFIKLPVKVMRPSGKITTFSPFSSNLMTFFIAKGLLGSTAKCGVKRKNWRLHQFFSTVVCTTKVARLGKKSPSNKPSKNDSWLATISSLFSAGMFSKPLTSTRNKILLKSLRNPAIKFII